MHRLHLSLLVAVLVTSSVACGSEPRPPQPAPDTGTSAEALRAAAADTGVTLAEVSRTRVAGDVFHYALTVQVGPTPNARLRVHRVVREGPGARPGGGVLLMHGDFATFVTHFAPSLGSPAGPSAGLATHLAEQGLDVWGFDRRWTLAAAGADVSDFADMGYAQELQDTRRVLAFARAVRLLTLRRDEPLHLGGFSRGAHLAYAYASQEAARPQAERHVKGLVVLDMYAELDPAETALRAAACARRDEGRATLEAGALHVDNTFFGALGTLAREAPDAESPLFPGTTNRGAMLFTVARTFLFFTATPAYHLASAHLDADGNPTALRESSEDAITAWLAGAPPLQSLRETVEGDALWCGEGPLPVTISLPSIRVPLLYVGAAGGYGHSGLYSTQRVGSTDVTTRVVQRFGPGGEAEDFGHVDLLYAQDARELAWAPVAQWLLAR
ncbi:MAG TPA: hypothetical protein VFO83_09420 [Aggregicoccus sp.]|nr:hypothetical protein [Aggregicoccus sp.]